jgi:hypothetical protein
MIREPDLFEPKTTNQRDEKKFWGLFKLNKLHSGSQHLITRFSIVIPMSPFFVHAAVTAGYENRVTRFGEYFAYWAVVYFGQLFENNRCSASFWAAIQAGRTYVY